MITCTPIGVVKCPVTAMSQGNWAKVESEIHLDPRYAPGLQGLAGFSHLIVVFYLHQATGFDPAKQLLRRPRGMEDMHEVGVFAQRTKYRPNPIGVSSVELRAVRDNVVVVRGLDALDGTPVLDIKPYMVEFAPRAAVSQPAWSHELLAGYF